MSSEETKQPRLDKRKVFVIWTNKGGVGKTTLSFHMATTFAKVKREEGWKVLVCDLCPQANISMTLLTSQRPEEKGEDIVDKFCQEPLKREFEIYRTVAGYISSFVSRIPEAKVPPEKFLVQPCKYNLTIPENIYLLCGDPDLGVNCERLDHYRRSPGGGKENPWREGTLALREFVDKACDGVDPDANWFVIIDTNPALTTYTQLALVAADQIIMPVNADEFSKVAVKALFGHLYRKEGGRFTEAEKHTFASKVQQHDVPLPTVRLLVNNRQTVYDTRASRAFSFMGEEIRDTLFQLFKNHPDRFVSGPKLVDFASGNDEKLLGCFEKAYTTDLRDLHSTGILCTYAGLPMSVVAAGLYSKHPAFKNLKKQHAINCDKAITALCMEVEKSLVPGEDEAGSPSQSQSSEKAERVEKSPSKVPAAPPQEKSLLEEPAKRPCLSSSP